MLIAIMGPTASGKSSLAEWVAEEWDLPLISADAFMVYRGLDIGTNKPADRTRYSLLDVADPREQFGLGEWLRRVSAELTAQGAVVVGGTGLYIRALFEQWTDLQGPPDPQLRGELEERIQREGLPALYAELSRQDPEGAARVDPHNPVRVRRALERLAAPKPLDLPPLPPVPRLKLGIDCPVPALDAAIETRCHKMLAGGWIEEVRDLLENGVETGAPGMKAIGYREIAETIQTGKGAESLAPILVTLTRQYAKRQRTWMRSEPNLNLLSVEGPQQNVSDGLKWHVRTFIEQKNKQATK